MGSPQDLEEDRVIIPESVASELAHDRAPEDVRSWIAGPPSWLEVRTPEAPDPTMKLDVGERDALSLALEIEADLVLVDDKAARTVAKDRRLSVAGTLAVLELASQREFLHAALEALTSTSFRVRKDVIATLEWERLAESSQSDPQYFRSPSTRHRQGAWRQVTGVVSVTKYLVS